MKSEKILVDDFNICITLSKKEAKQLFYILNRVVNMMDCPIADGIINGLRQYDLDNQNVKKEENEVLEFTYQNHLGEITRRKVKISSIFNKDKRFYFKGMDMFVNETRTFLYSRMNEIYFNKRKYNVMSNLIAALYKKNRGISIDVGTLLVINNGSFRDAIN